MGDEIGYRRNASFWNSPNTSDPKRVHRDNGDGFAVCNRTKIMLNRDAPVVLTSLPHDDSLCRRCFPDAGLGLPLAEVVAP